MTIEHPHLPVGDAELAAEAETGIGWLDLDLGRRLVAEALGTCLLVAAVIGSGIAASQLSAGDIGLQLLENAAATTGALIGLILMFGGVSGAHFNPAVTLLDGALGTMRRADVGLYIVAQVVGAGAGAVLANLMFALPAIEISTTDRSSGAHWLSEVVATVTLLLLIQSCVRSGRSNVVPFAVGAWIGGAYWFTSSTSFANPAVTAGRTLSDTFAGIAPASVPMFVAMQVLGAAIAYLLVRLFYPTPAMEQPDA
jgi:glycerol uptake facilitator-like aquaporin